MVEKGIGKMGTKEQGMNREAGKDVKGMGTKAAKG